MAWNYEIEVKGQFRMGGDGHTFGSASIGVPFDPLYQSWSDDQRVAYDAAKAQLDRFLPSHEIAAAYRRVAVTLRSVFPAVTVSRYRNYDRSTTETIGG